jgi:hypothetical protein
VGWRGTVDSQPKHHLHVPVDDDCRAHAAGIAFSRAHLQHNRMLRQSSKAQGTPALLIYETKHALNGCLASSTEAAHIHENKPYLLGHLVHPVNLQHLAILCCHQAVEDRHLPLDEGVSQEQLGQV